MYTIGLDLSRNQLNKLKKGAKARVKKGMGCNLIVRPENYSILSRAFRRNKGVDISLSPEEIELNMLPSPEEQRALMEQTNMDMASSEAVGAGLNWKKIGKTVKKQGLDFAKKQGPKIGVKLTKEGYKAYSEQDDDDVYGEGLGAGMGAGYGNLYKAHMGDYKAGLSQLEQSKKRASKSLHSGLTGGAMHTAVIHPSMRKGQRLYTRGNGLNLVEGRGVGNITNQHQALQPQPYSANYHFKFMLPTQYQELSDISGNGLYV